MDLTAARIVLRPRSLIEISDLAIRFVFGLSGNVYLRLGLLTLVPGLVLTIALRYLIGWPWYFVWLAAVTYGTVAQGAFTLLASRLLFSREVTARAILDEFARRLPSYLFALLLSRCLILLGSATCLLALPAWTKVSFVHEASLLEAAGPRAAISRSFNFTRGYASTAFANVLNMVTLTIAFVMASDLLLQGTLESLLMLPSAEPGAQGSWESPYAVLGYYASLPIVATARFLTYIDARTRRDGWDIQVRFLALASPSREGTTP